MQRLLTGADDKFLERNGFKPRALRRFRAHRRLVFRAYLRCLARDFNRVYWTLEVAVAEADQNRAGMIGLLLQQRARFVLAMLVAELRLAMHGWGAGTIDLHLMLESLETLRGAWKLLSTQREMAV
jgi:hypothetical protein